jgi:hypothetical protein
MVDRKRKGKTQLYTLNREGLLPAQEFLAKLK